MWLSLHLSLSLSRWCTYMRQLDQTEQNSTAQHRIGQNKSYYIIWNHMVDWFIISYHIILRHSPLQKSISYPLSLSASLSLFLLLSLLLSLSFFLSLAYFLSLSPVFLNVSLFLSLFLFLLLIFHFFPFSFFSFFFLDVWGWGSNFFRRCPSSTYALIIVHTIYILSMNLINDNPFSLFCVRNC